MKIRLIKLLFVLSIVLINISCINKEMKKVKPRWQPVVSTPKDYPVTVFDGILTYPKSGGESIMPAGIVNNAWGSEGGSFTTLQSPSAPDGVGIRWYSFVDDKYYQGFSDLPYDTIKELFSKGIISSETKRPDNFNYIVVGLAPGGIVSVWLSGDGTTIEVANFKAKEVDLDLGEELPSGMRDYYRGANRDSSRLDWRRRLLKRFPHIQEDINANKPIPEGLWDKTYREKFDSRVHVNFADSTAILDMMTMRFMNGEQEPLMFEAMKENAFKKRPRFVEVVLKWSFGRELQKSRMELDEREVLEAYNKIYENESPEMQVELRVDVNEANDFIRVYLCAVGKKYPKEVELDNSDIEIYPIDEVYRFKYDVFRGEYEDYEEGIPRRKDGKRII